MQSPSRYTASQPPVLAEGWSLERLTPVSRVFGANGMCTGADGRVYVAQCVGSQISALDVDSGELEVVCAKGGEIIAPDDLAFDARGNLYVTEFMEGRVSVLERDGRTRVLCDEVPGANGITFHQGRLFVDECRIGGRLVELSLDGGAPRVLLDELMLPNALAAGPDGWLYFPLVGAGEIWRVHPDRGGAERVAAQLHHPVAVKFDTQGHIVTPQSETGEVLRIDPRSGERSVMARLDPCLDNLTFVGERLFVSHHVDGRITEILADGKLREVVPSGFQFPLDLTLGEDGTLYCSDNSSIYALAPGGALQRVAWLFGPGFPGSVRSLALAGKGTFVVTTTDGRIVRYRPADGDSQVLAEGFDQLYGLALGARGEIVVAERAAGRVLVIESGSTRVLADGLREPMGVALDGDDCWVSEAGAGRIVKLAGGRAQSVLEGLQQPQGIAVRAGSLYALDAGARQVVAIDLRHRSRNVLAAELPVGAPPGVRPKPLRGVPPFSGPMGPFAGLAAGADGALYVSADAEGSVLALRPPR